MWYNIKEKKTFIGDCTWKDFAFYETNTDLFSPLCLLILSWKLFQEQYVLPTFSDTSHRNLKANYFEIEFGI